MKSIQEIKEEFQNAAEEELLELCGIYSTDSRKAYSAYCPRQKKNAEA